MRCVIQARGSICGAGKRGTRLSSAESTITRRCAGGTCTERIITCRVTRATFKGKPPLNLKYGVFETTNGPDGPFHRVDYSPKDKFRPLSQPPKDFRGPDFPPLPGTPQPVIQARLIRNGNRGVPITYDYASKKFVQAGAPIAGRPAPPVVIANFGAHAEYFRPPVSIGGTGGTNGGGGSSGGSHGRSGGGGGSPPRSGGGGAPRGGGGGGSPRGGGGRSAAWRRWRWSSTRWRR